MKNAGIVLLIYLMASCGRNEQPTAPVITPTDKPVAIAPTDKPMQVSTATQMPFQFPTPTIDRLLVDCWIPTGLAPQESPDGQWIAAPCDLGAASHLKIINKQEASVWEPSFQEITNISSCWPFANGIGEPSCFDGILHIHHWDKDSRYVFVNIDYLVDRGIDFSFGLYRLDVKTHQISPWLQTSLDYTYRYAFSPNNENLAYVSSADPYTIYVNSIETGQVTNYDIPGQPSAIAYLAWSPDNQKVAFSILHEGWFNSNMGGFSLALLDLKKGKITILIPEDKRLFYPSDWTSDTVIKLSNRTGLPDYQYDLESDELEAVL